MFQPTGSVYLDTPQQGSRRPPVPRVSATRVTVAGILAALGICGLSALVAVTGLRAVVLEPTPVLEAFEATLDDPAARTEVAEEVARGIEHSFVGDDLTEVAALYGMDVAAEARRVSKSVIADPAFRHEFLGLVTELHSRTFLTPGGADDVDLEPISQAVRDVIRREAPDLAAIIPAESTLWMLDAGTVPDLSGVVDALDRSRLAALAAAIALPLALVIHPRHHRVVSWIGRWALVTGLLGGISAIGLPYLAGRISGWSAVEVGVRSASVRLIAPAAVAGVIGALLVSFAAVAGRREARRVSEEGAKVALGWDEPEPWQQTAQPTLDLASRGLVDANHPLTNI